MKVVRTAELPWADGMQQGLFRNRRKGLGGEKMPCSLWEISPGNKSFPLHMHHVTEEAMFVVSGTGKVRAPTGDTPIGPGDYVSFPAGDAAHQVVNDGTVPLVFVGMSVVSGFDIVEYPESGKVAVSMGRPPTGKRMLFKTNSEVEYFDGEKDAQLPAK